MIRYKDILKETIALLPYSLKSRTNGVLLVIFLLTGFVWDIAYRGSGWIGLWFVLLFPLVISQQLNSVALSNMVQSSTRKRNILVTVPCLIMGISTIAIYLGLFIIRLVLLKSADGISRLALFSLVLYGAFEIMFVIYNLFVFRKPVIGYVVLVFLLIMIFAVNPTGFIPPDNPNMIYGILGTLLWLPVFDSIYTAFAAGLILTVISIVLFYALSVAFYKLPLSERNYKYALNRSGK